MRTVWIYTLNDPITDEVKYVGKTFRLARRLNDHMRCPGNNKKDTWIKSLKKKGLKPILELLEETNELECDFLERFWICQFKVWGFKLKNMTDGGDGSYGLTPWNKGLKGVFSHSSESKKKMSNSRIGKTPYVMTEKIKNKISESKTGKEGHKWNEEQQKRMSGNNSPVSKRICCFNMNGEFIKEYVSAAQAEIDGFCRFIISKVCLGKVKSHKNHIFKFV